MRSAKSCSLTILEEQLLVGADLALPLAVARAYSGPVQLAGVLCPVQRSRLAVGGCAEWELRAAWQAVGPRQVQVGDALVWPVGLGACVTGREFQGLLGQDVGRRLGTLPPGASLACHVVALAPRGLLLGGLPRIVWLIFLYAEVLRRILLHQVQRARVSKRLILCHLEQFLLLLLRAPLIFKLSLHLVHLPLGLFFPLPRLLLLLHQRIHLVFEGMLLLHHLILEVVHFLLEVLLEI